jgi:acyl-[acyl-carrier-protein]-phospholipid O-acyltransferase/long-chain-fatty-acid--[acyl-carrier-protein] ligase
MSAPDLSLLGTRRLGPLFVVQFLGALNDNLLKFAMLFLANYSLYAAAPEKAETLGVVATGLFILPYFLFSALGGQIADSIDKAKLIRAVKAAEILFMIVGLAGFWLQSVPLLLLSLFLMGCHSTIFGPAKYAIIPQHLREGEVMGGTGLIEAGTFLAILSGQLLAGIMEPMTAGLLATAFAVVGFAASLFIPAAPATAPGLRVDPNVLRSTWTVLKGAHKDGRRWLAILGISWFFTVGAVLLAEFPALTGSVLGARPEVGNLFLIIFSVSIAIGSLAVNRLLKGEVSARYVPASALVLAVAMVALWLATRDYQAAAPAIGIGEFVAHPLNWLIMALLSVIAVAGGVFVVPLYAILQTESPKEERSRVIAANNIVNAAVTVVVVAIVTGMIAAGVRAPGIIGSMGFATLSIAFISCWLLPETVIKAMVKGALRLLYRVEIVGAEHMPKPGERAVVVVNHVSFLDGLLLAAFLPGKPTFAIHSHIARTWWAKLAMRLFHAFPVDPTNPMAAKAMVKTVREGNTLVIFPKAASPSPAR